MASTIELTDIGPIRHLSIPVPENGGLVVLKGGNGMGKSTAIAAVESAITGRGKPEVRDGAISGSVEAFGVTMRVGRSKRVTGELEVQSLEGRLSVAELVDPGIKSPDAADAKRIKALVQLAKVQPSPELFYDLVGGREPFEALVSKTAAESEDLVLMSERIKRDLEAEARKAESQAEHAEGRFRGAHDAAQGIDLGQPSDSDKLQKALELALQAHASLQSRADAHGDAAAMAEKARQDLDAAEAGYKGPSLVEATEARNKAQGSLVDAVNAVSDAEKALREAKQTEEICRVKLASADRAKFEAERHNALVSQWRKQLDACIPDCPSTEQLGAAAAKVVDARQAIETGVLVRRAQQHLSEAEKAQADAKAQRNRADKLREAAKGTDEVLSGVVGRSGANLRVQAGRLVLDTKRGETFFADLSAGERWKIALDIAIEAVGPRGVLALCQEAWEGLDGRNRQLIADHVKDRGVIVLTAECSEDPSEGELSAALYGGNGK